MAKMTAFQLNGQSVAAIIDIDDFIKMIERMKEKGYEKVIHTSHLGEVMWVSDNDLQYNISFGLPTTVFKNQRPDLYAVICDGLSAHMLIFAKNEKVKDLNLGTS